MKQKFIRFFLCSLAVMAGDSHVHVVGNDNPFYIFNPLQNILGNCNCICSFSFCHSQRHCRIGPEMNVFL